MSPAGGGARLSPAHELAFRAAFEEHGPHVFAFVLRLTRDRVLAEDLLQETWIDFVRAFAHLNHARSLRPWLLTAARNRWRMHRRWAWVDPARWMIGVPDPFEPDPAPGPEADLEASRRVRTLERAIARLSVADREAILLAADEGLTPADRAGIVGLSEAAFRQRLHRARQALQRLIEASHGDVP